MNKDILIKLAIELDLPDIIRLCSVNRKINKTLCQNDIFWMNKFYHDYGYHIKISNKSWKDFYKYVTTMDPTILLWLGVENNILIYVVISLIRAANIEDVKHFEYFNDTPLSLASQYGYLEIVKYLLKNGANIHSENDRALMVAVYEDNLDVVKYLVENGADIHAEDGDAFFFAKQMDHKDIYNYLIEIMKKQMKN